MSSNRAFLDARALMINMIDTKYDDSTEDLAARRKR